MRLIDRIGTSLSGVHHYARLNPPVGLVWRVGSGVSIYGGYAEANRAPTPTELSCADPDQPCSLTAFFLSDPELHQVVSRTFEAGMRGTHKFGHAQLSWRMGGWRSRNANDIIFTASTTTGRAYFRNVGETQRQGIETELNVAAGSWRGRVSYVLTDATYRTTFLLNSPDNPNADSEGVIAVAPGNRIPGIAGHRFKASVTRHSGTRLWVSLDGQYSSGRWFLEDEANLTRPTHNYWLANISAGLKPAEQVELFVEIRNMFDKKYATFGGFSATGDVNFREAPGLTNPRSLSPAAPRTWLLGARVTF